jgi:hypothetical protein
MCVYNKTENKLIKNEAFEASKDFSNLMKSVAQDFTLKPEASVWIVE